MRLRKKFLDKVGAGKDLYTMLITTATGTGPNLSTGNRVGLSCLDISADVWFLCTATTGTGTWVAINA